MEILMTPNPSWTITGVLSKISTALAVIPSIVPFLLFAHPSKIYPKILSFARAVKADLPPGGKLGAAGFCWGAWPATKLCVETTSTTGTVTAAPDSDTSASPSRLIDAQFNGHPSYMVKTPEMVVDAIRKFKVPYSCAVAENDMQFNKAEAEKVEARLREVVGASTGTTSGGEGEGEGCTYEFKVYDGCVHGFCVRAPIGKYDDTNESGYEGAKRQAVEWFDKYLN
jgi:dienelactone hydrolase